MMRCQGGGCNTDGWLHAALESRRARGLSETKEGRGSEVPVQGAGRPSTAGRCGHELQVR
jgi:hypothetical protein